MQRRYFLSLIGAAFAAPALPAVGAPASAAVGYNRYMYGLAVFQARTRANLNVADLAARLGVSSSQASAMMGEMTARGVLSSVTGAARIASPGPARKPYLRKMLRQIAKTHGDLDAPPKTDPASARSVHAPCTTCDN